MPTAEPMTRGLTRYHRHDLDEARETSNQQPVGEPDRPEQERKGGRDEHDDQGDATHVGAQLESDQMPRVAYDLSSRPW
jgi:hypothetical protein